jgi:hypothetical protein
VSVCCFTLFDEPGVSNLWETPYSSEIIKLFLYTIKQHTMKMYKTAAVQVAKTALTAALDAVGGQLMFWPLYPKKKTPISFKLEARCASELVWTW